MALPKRMDNAGGRRAAGRGQEPPLTGAQWHEAEQETAPAAGEAHRQAFETAEEEDGGELTVREAAIWLALLRVPDVRKSYMDQYRRSQRKDPLDLTALLLMDEEEREEYLKLGKLPNELIALGLGVNDSTVSHMTKKALNKIKLEIHKTVYRRHVS